MKVVLNILFLVSICAYSQEIGKVYKLSNTGEIVEEKVEFEDSVSVDDLSLTFNNVHYNNKFKALMEKRIVYHEQHPYVEGYRVQIRKSTNIEELMALRSKFLELFPNEPIAIEGNLPYMLLRVGNHVGVWGIWKAKLQAELLKRYFDRAVYVRTSIYVDDLIEKKEENEEQD